MVKIAVDGRLLQGNLTGVGKFVLNLIEYICNGAGDVVVIVYSNRKLICKFESPRIKVVYDSVLMAKVKPMIWSRFFLSRLVNADRPDIFFSGDGFIPLFLSKCKVVSLIHDFNRFIVPETMSSLRLLTDKLFQKKDIKKAGLIISNSYGTAAKLEKYFGRKTDLVIHPLIDKWYRVIDKPTVKAELQKLNVSYPYILSVATQEPRKNLDKTILAFISLKKKGLLKDYKLLLVGGRGWKYTEISKLIDENKEDVVTLGYTPDELMPYLYNGADLFVFPSSYEGYGMPVREAMLCGVKVVTTNIPELREASFHLGRYIDSSDPEILAEAISGALHDPYQVSDPRGLEDNDQIEELIPTLLQDIIK